MYNRSIIFKNAWKIKKRENFTLSKSLKISWKYEKEKIKNDNFDSVFKELSGIINYYSIYLSKRMNIEKEDAHQKISLKVFKVLNNYNSSFSSIKTFFNRVIKNYSVDLLRSFYAKKYKQVNIDLFDIIDKKNYYSEIETFESLKQLSENFEGNSRVVFDKLIDGLKIKDIADELNFSSNNVSNIIRRKIRPKVFVNFG